MLNQNFVLIGVALSLYGGIKYIIATVQGRVRPNRVTWFMWALAPLIAFGAELDKGVGLPALMTFIVGFNPLMIFLASFVNNKSYWELTAFDFICGVLSLAGLVLWLISREGNYAIVFSIMADALAAIPTLVKSYKHPESENALIFAMGGINAIFALLTIKHWTFAGWGFPLYILLINIVFVLFIHFRLGLKLSVREKSQG
jgi:hypothetical protein